MASPVAGRELVFVGERRSRRARQLNASWSSGGLGDWLHVVAAPIQARGAGVVSIPPRFPVPPALAEPGGGQEFQLTDSAQLPGPGGAGHAACLSTSATWAW